MSAKPVCIHEHLRYMLGYVGGIVPSKSIVGWVPHEPPGENSSCLDPLTLAGESGLSSDYSGLTG